VALFGGKVVQLLGHHPRVGFHHGIFVSLELLYVLPKHIEDFQLRLGSFAGLLGLCKLGSELVEGDEPFGGHVLEPATLLSTSESFLNHTLDCQ
jgi:hypothetical protein